MTKANLIENEALMLIAQRYADKIKASGMNPSAEELQAVIAANWTKIAGQICTVTQAANSIM